MVLQIEKIYSLSFSSNFHPLQITKVNDHQNAREQVIHLESKVEYLNGKVGDLSSSLKRAEDRIAQYEGLSAQSDDTQQSTAMIEMAQLRKDLATVT